jgi:large subunit ribosomal protein L9
MKVILLEDIQDLGKKYEVKEVKSGHARNFLIPKKLAKLATKQALKWLDSQKEVIEKEIEEDLKKAQETASKIDGLDIMIKVKVGEHGELFEGINSQKISEKLKELGFDVKKSQIALAEPIKELGEFPIKVNLDHNLEVEINVTILAEGGVKNEEE